MKKAKNKSDESVSGGNYPDSQPKIPAHCQVIYGNDRFCLLGHQSGSIYAAYLLDGEVCVKKL